MTRFFSITSGPHIVCAILIVQLQSVSALLATPVLRTTQTVRSSHALFATTLEAPTIDKPRQEEATKERRRSDEEEESKDFDGRWEIWLYDDTVNFAGYVAEQLVRVGDLTELKAYRCMKQADRTGQSVLGEYSLEMAEHYTSALKSRGLVVEMMPLEGDFQ